MRPYDPADNNGIFCSFCAWISFQITAFHPIVETPGLYAHGMRFLYYSANTEIMKNHILKIFTATAFAAAMIGCQDSRNTASTGEETETHSDTTYMESLDDNGQPTSGSEGGGTVNETKGAAESGYRNSNNTELHPSSTGSSGSAAQRGEKPRQ